MDGYVRLRHLYAHPMVIRRTALKYGQKAETRERIDMKLCIETEAT